MSGPNFCSGHQEGPIRGGQRNSSRCLEGMRQKSLNGEIYLRACDHQMQSPLPVAVINSKTYPYVGVPTMIPASAIAIEESAIDNPRCKKK